MQHTHTHTHTLAQAAQATIASGTYLWGDLVRLDVVAAPSSTRLAFYGPNTLRIRALPLVKVGRLLPPPHTQRAIWSAAASQAWPPPSLHPRHANSNLLRSLAPPF